MSKHPWDWLIHFLLCFAAIFFKQATILAVIFVAVMVEYLQWDAAGRPEIIHYFIYKSLGDLIADALGIIAGVLL